jgi:hypothetical protein
MVGKSQVVVAGQVDNLFAVVMAYRGLLIVENPEMEVSALGTKFIEDCGKVGELGTRVSLSHGDTPQTASI